MDERQRRIEEKILRKEGELKALKGQLAELEKKKRKRQSVKSSDGIRNC